MARVQALAVPPRLPRDDLGRAVEGELRLGGALLAAQDRRAAVHGHLYGVSVRRGARLLVLDLDDDVVDARQQALQARELALGVGAQVVVDGRVVGADVEVHAAV